MIRQITVLGSTGSIGQSTLDVVRRHPDQYAVFALSAARSVERMLADIEEFAPRYVVMAEPSAAAQLMAELAPECRTEVREKGRTTQSISLRLSTEYLRVQEKGVGSPNRVRRLRLIQREHEKVARRRYTDRGGQRIKKRKKEKRVGRQKKGKVKN